MIPDKAVEAAYDSQPYGADPVISKADIERLLEAAAPHMLADILGDAANTAETDELTTAAEVIYDLRRHAKDLRPTE